MLPIRRLALVATLLTSFASGAASAEPAVPTKGKKNVELVFALDTTGSMGGLLEGAKQKIWFVTNEVLKSEHKPKVKIGLVAFRDKGDAYITQELPLTDDLDLVYETLMGYRADGGGDGPEHVNAALEKAVTGMKWSEGKDTLRMVFLVGDAPPHMDYADDIKHDVVSRVALKNNIYINTIQCGADPETRNAFTSIARNTEGRYAAIAQDGGVVAVRTPFDDELGRLSAELDGTFLSYGARSAREEKDARRAAIAEAAPASAMADRASVRAKVKASKSEDLVALYEAEGGGAVASVDEDALPAELVGKTEAERAEVVKKMKADRERIQKQIAEISKKRDGYLESERKKAGAKPTGFDAEVVEMVYSKM